MKKNIIFLIIGIIVSVISTILILVFEETDLELGSEIAAVFLIVGVSIISIFSRLIKRDRRRDDNNSYQNQSNQPVQQLENNPTITCEYCGAKNEKTDSKCISCGARLK
jgi:DNA-directed RNA polymerase subunit RPC12/RpoP